MKVVNSVLELIGNTPLMRLNRVTDDCGASILAKLEFLNPTGSIKDRIVLSMIEAAEKEGIIKPGSTTIEDTSGNTRAYAAILVFMSICFHVINQRKQ